MSKLINWCFVFILIFYTVKADVDDRYCPRIHLAPPYGWMNDPNGFSVYQDEYHLFYQYNPESSLEPGIAHWGHAKSKDFFNWEHLPIAMYPDKDYDKNGVFSGSAIVENSTMYLFYTGNVNFPGESPDHIQRQALASSTDGINYEKYKDNPIIRGDEYQPNLRDPKVWKHDDTYYMVLGNSFNNGTIGRVLLYSSENMIAWKQVSVISQSDGSLGYMWECPDFFELDGHFVLLISPQGIKPQGDKYKNLYQTGYIVGHFDYKDHTFTRTTEFQELDHGHDFYATQSILDNDGRRVVVAWCDMWEENYPERADGFTGLMTIPRVLSLSREGRLIQVPVKEIEAMISRVIRRGRARNGTVATLEDKTGEVKITAQNSKDLELFIESDGDRLNSVRISYDFAIGTLTLDRGGEDGVRRTQWQPTGSLYWKIYVDASSVELFCGEGEVTFSSRFFPDGPVRIRLGSRSEAEDMTVSLMKRSVHSTKLLTKN